MKQKQAAAIYDFASVLLTSIIAVAVIFTFFFKISTVNGDSMRHTLHNGDQLIITAHDSDVKYGDIVIVSQPNAYDEVLVKRVIATGGQTINIDSVGRTVYQGKNEIARRCVYLSRNRTRGLRICYGR